MRGIDTIDQWIVSAVRRDESHSNLLFSVVQQVMLMRDVAELAHKLGPTSELLHRPNLPPATLSRRRNGHSEVVHSLLLSSLVSFLSYSSRLSSSLHRHPHRRENLTSHFLSETLPSRRLSSEISCVLEQFIWCS